MDVRAFRPNGPRRSPRGSPNPNETACSLRTPCRATRRPPRASARRALPPLPVPLLRRQGPALHVVCSLASGVIAQTVVMPIDVVKSHLMLGGGGWRAVASGVRAHGPAWLYRGYAPAAAGQGLVMLLQMPIIEELRRLLGVAAI